MIKIQEHLNIENVDDFLDSKAQSMWNHLNPIITNGEYHYNSLIKKLDRLIIQSNSLNYLEEISNNDRGILKRQKSFLEYLFKNNYFNLKQLVISRPNLLANQKIEIFKVLQESDIYYEHQGRYKQTPFGDLLLDSLFNYKNLRKSSFCRQLIVDCGYQNVTCPYCNDNRISIIDISTETDEDIILKAYLDLDHFFSKAQNPFFAISFYNLIPSCHDCNSIEKGDLVFDLLTHTHPYVKSFNENYLFEINPDFFLTRSTDVIKLTYKGNTIDYNDRDFKLSQRYQGIHLDSVNQLIKLYIDYQDYRYSSEFYHDWKSALLQNVPMYKKDILRKPVGKMYRDVLKQIDVFNLLPD